MGQWRSPVYLKLCLSDSTHRHPHHCCLRERTFYVPPLSSGLTHLSSRLIMTHYKHNVLILHPYTNSNSVYYRQTLEILECDSYLSQVQTELTCQRIQELETQATSDLELRNNRIDELTRTNEELKHQVQAQSKVRSCTIFNIVIVFKALCFLLFSYKQTS